MTPAEARSVVAVIAAGCGKQMGEELILLWIEFMTGLDNAGRAGAAARDYVKAWDGFTPKWADYDDCYQARTRRAEPIALNPGGQPVSLVEHLEWLQGLAADGDVAAGHELTLWRKQATKLTAGRSERVRATLAGSAAAEGLFVGLVEWFNPAEVVATVEHTAAGDLEFEEVW